MRIDEQQILLFEISYKILFKKMYYNMIFRRNNSYIIILLHFFFFCFFQVEDVPTFIDKI